MNSEPPQEEPISLLSVIVPVYNAEPFLPRCLESLIHQTYRNLEIICVNDGSTDGSAAILDEYAAKDSRIKVIHQKNAGVSVARNQGLDAATGEFLTFVDADDWVEPDAYEKAAAAMSDDVDLVSVGTQVDGAIDSVYRDILVRHLTMQARCREPLTPELQVELGGEIWNKVYRRKLLEAGNVRFPVGQAYGEDKVFYFSYASQAKAVSSLPDSLYHYCLRENSAMSQFGAANKPGDVALLVLQRVRQYYASHGIKELRMRPVLAFLYEEYVMFALGSMNEKERRLAWLLSRELKVRRMLRRPESLALMQEYIPRWEKNFHWYAQNRECFGLCGRSVISVTFESECRVHRLFGCRVWASSKK